MKEEFGLRYEEFIPILIAKVQKQQEQIEKLMERDYKLPMYAYT